MPTLRRPRLAALALLGLYALLLTACQPAEPGMEASTRAESEVKPETKAETPAAVLAGFEADVKACTSLVNALELDPEFMDAFGMAQRRNPKPVEVVLGESAVADLPEVKYFLSHRKYMALGMTLFKCDPWAVAWMDNEVIYCAPTLERLREIEELGESAEAWRIRLFFLNKALELLRMPWDESEDPRIEFDRFKTYVLEASRRYTGAQQAALRAWLNKAIQTLEVTRKDIAEGAASQMSQQQHQMMDERIAFLRQLAQPAK